MAYLGSEFIEHPVRVGEIFVSCDKMDIISAIGLGSCIGVMAFDPEISVGGIAHIQLPNSSDMGSFRSRRPYANADKGIAELLRQLQKHGASKKRLVVVLAGGAQIGKGDDYFKVGLKNQEACIQILDKHRLAIHKKRLGGNSWRSVKLHLITGQISIREKNGALELINVPGVLKRKTIDFAENFRIKNAKDIEKALAHLTHNPESVKAKASLKVNNLEDIKRVLSHLAQEENKGPKDKSPKTQNNLSDIFNILKPIIHPTNEK